MHLKSDPNIVNTQISRASAVQPLDWWPLQENGKSINSYKDIWDYDVSKAEFTLKPDLKNAQVNRYKNFRERVFAIASQHADRQVNSIDQLLELDGKLNGRLLASVIGDKRVREWINRNNLLGYKKTHLKSSEQNIYVPDYSYDIDGLERLFVDPISLSGSNPSLNAYKSFNDLKVKFKDANLYISPKPAPMRSILGNNHIQFKPFVSSEKKGNIYLSPVNVVDAKGKESKEFIENLQQRCLIYRGKSFFTTMSVMGFKDVGHDLGFYFDLNQQGKVQKLGLINSHTLDNNESDKVDQVMLYSLPVLSVLDKANLLDHNLTEMLYEIRKGIRGKKAFANLSKKTVFSALPLLGVNLLQNQVGKFDKGCMRHAISNITQLSSVVNPVTRKLDLQPNGNDISQESRDKLKELFPFLYNTKGVPDHEIHRLNASLVSRNKFFMEHGLHLYQSVIAGDVKGEMNVLRSHIFSMIKKMDPTVDKQAVRINFNHEYDPERGSFVIKAAVKGSKYDVIVQEKVNELTARHLRPYVYANNNNGLKMAYAEINLLFKEVSNNVGLMSLYRKPGIVSRFNSNNQAGKENVIRKIMDKNKKPSLFSKIIKKIKALFSALNPFSGSKSQIDSSTKDNAFLNDKKNEGKDKEVDNMKSKNLDSKVIDGATEVRKERSETKEVKFDLEKGNSENKDTNSELNSSPHSFSLDDFASKKVDNSYKSEAGLRWKKALKPASFKKSANVGNFSEKFSEKNYTKGRSFKSL